MISLASCGLWQALKFCLGGDHLIPLALVPALTGAVHGLVGGCDNDSGGQSQSARSGRGRATGNISQGKGRNRGRYVEQVVREGFSEEVKLY